MMEICVWNDFAEEMLTSWDINNQKEQEDLQIPFPVYSFVNNDRRII